MKKKVVKYVLENRVVDGLLSNGFYFSNGGQLRDSSLRFIKVSYKSLGFVRVVDRHDFKRGEFWVFERCVTKWLRNGFYFDGGGFEGLIIDDELLDHPFKLGDLVKIGFRFKSDKVFDLKIVYLGEEVDDGED